MENLEQAGAKHEHKFKEVPWDEEKRGPSMVDVTQYHATYRNLLRCACGKEQIHSVRHLREHGPQ